MVNWTRHWRAAVGGAVAALLAGAGLVAPAQAGWTNPATTLGAMAYHSQILVNDAGTSFAVWQDELTDGARRVVLSTRAPGATWTAPQVVTSGDYTLKLDGAVLLPNGQVAVGWEKSLGANNDHVTYLTIRNAAGTLTTTRLSMVGKDAYNMDIAANTRGDMVIAWDNSEGIWMRYRSGATGAWTAVGSVRTNSSQNVFNVRSASAGIDDAGRATIVWREGTCESTPSATCSLFASSRTSSGAWSAPSAALGSSTDPRLFSNLVVGPNGEMVVLYVRYSVPLTVYARTKTATGAWSAPQALGTDVYEDPMATISAAGEISVIWAESTPDLIKVASRPSGGAWGTHVTVGEGELATMAAASDGSLITGWMDKTGAVGVRARDTSGEWNEPNRVTAVEPRENVSAAANGGRGVLGWIELSDGALRVSDYSAAAAALGDVVVPAALKANEQGAFSATTSSWLPGAAISWDFGDGGVVTGSSATHAYSANGTYTVTVRASDASGAVREQKHQVVVTGAVVGPKLRKFKLKRDRIARVGSRSTKPQRTRVVVKLSQRAKVRFVVKRVVKVKGKTVKRKVGAFGKRLPRGKSRFWLRAKVGKKSLKPGRYVIVARAKNAHGRSATKRQRLIVLR